MRVSSWLLAAAVALGTTLPAAAERLTERPLVDAAWLADNLGHEALVVIDVRDPTKDANPYALGHVPGALHAPYASFGWRTQVEGVVGQLPPVAEISGRIGSLGVSNDRHVVIVAEGSDSSEFGKATRVYWTFKVLGHDAVSILDGGQRAWEAAGLPMSTEGRAPEPDIFVATFRPELIASTDQVRAASTRRGQLVDARPAAQYSGAQKSPVARVAGTIPGAVNIEQSSFFGGSFVASDVVERLARAAGLRADEPTIAFCNTGHWASIAWFGLSEVAGQPGVALYDGSMAEWTADAERLVELKQ